jgi:hypothetical protein
MEALAIQAGQWALSLYKGLRGASLEGVDLSKIKSEVEEAQECVNRLAYAGTAH